MLNEIKHIPILVRQYGISRLGLRFYFDITRRTGLLKSKFPLKSWEGSLDRENIIEGTYFDGISTASLLTESSFRFFFNPGDPPSLDEKYLTNAVNEVDNLKKGNFLYFSRNYGTLGYPDTDWLLNPFTNKRFNTEKHWVDLTDFNTALGDIKYIWEPSRFGWVYPLARMYAMDRMDENAEIFWTLLESWMESNPQNKGPNWQCGQETAIRSFAIIFGVFTFLKSTATTESRLLKVLSLLYASAERIVHHINYARIQMGNHAVSEAGALWTIGHLFPFLKNAERWRKFGKYVLEDEIRNFNHEDGSYIQHSMNYQRLMLYVYLWCLRLAEINSVRFNDLTYDRIRNSYLFLYNMQDNYTGFTSNYGPNDGANILPLSNCDYPDFRPLIQAFHYFFTKKRIYDDGPYDEMLLWLFGPESVKAKVESIERQSADYLSGGYHTFRRKNSWGMTRCHTYRSRPNQADMLHFDLWWNGINLLRDSGTYSYYDPGDNWNHFFVSTRAHNTVEIGNADQMIKGNRFRWYSLLDSRFHFHVTTDDFEIWQGEHNGYRRLPCKAVHRRAIVNIHNDIWIVIDDILGHGRELTRLIWNCPDVPYRDNKNGILLSTANGDAEIIIRACHGEPRLKILYGQDSDSRFGFRSLYYGEKNPTPVLVAESASELPHRYITVISLGKACPDLKLNHSSLLIKSKEKSANLNIEFGLLENAGSCVDKILIGNKIAWKNQKGGNKS